MVIPFRSLLVTLMCTGSVLVGKVARLPFALNLFPVRVDDFRAQVAREACFVCRSYLFFIF